MAASSSSPSGSSAPSVPSSPSTPDYHGDEVAFVLGHIFEAVKRSLCESHFAAFESFHVGLRELSEELVGTTSVIQAPLFTVFPCFPFKIQAERWLFFQNWLFSELGEGIRDLCIPWCTYALDSIDGCNMCNEASTTVDWLAGAGVGEDSDDNVGADDDEIEFDSDGVEEDVPAANNVVEPQVNEENPDVANVDIDGAPGVADDGDQDEEDGPSSSDDSVNSGERAAKRPKL